MRSKLECEFEVVCFVNCCIENRLFERVIIGLSGLERIFVRAVFLSVITEGFGYIFNRIRKNYSNGDTIFFAAFKGRSYRG